MEYVNYISVNCGMPSENGSKDMWLIMDISFVLDGWSHVEPRKVSEQTRPAVPNTRHHHPQI
jgi:hypothetical protein